MHRNVSSQSCMIQNHQLCHVENLLNKQRFTDNHILYKIKRISKLTDAQYTAYINRNVFFMLAVFLLTNKPGISKRPKAGDEL